MSHDRIGTENSKKVQSRQVISVAKVGMASDEGCRSSLIQPRSPFPAMSVLDMWYLAPNAKLIT